eukprot:Gb_37532 [translate_table: standard]
MPNQNTLQATRSRRICEGVWGKHWRVLSGGIGRFNIVAETISSVLMDASNPIVHPIGDHHAVDLEEGPLIVTMKELPGMPGTIGGLALRVGQFLFAAAAIVIMVTGDEFTNYTAFCQPATMFHMLGWQWFIVLRRQSYKDFQPRPLVVAETPCIMHSHFIRVPVYCEGIHWAQHLLMTLP